MWAFLRETGDGRARASTCHLPVPWAEHPDQASWQTNCWLLRSGGGRVREHDRARPDLGFGFIPTWTGERTSFVGAPRRLGLVTCDSPLKGHLAKWPDPLGDQ